MHEVYTVQSNIVNQALISLSCGTYAILFFWVTLWDLIEVQAKSRLEEQVAYIKTSELEKF